MSHLNIHQEKNINTRYLEYREIILEKYFLICIIFVTVTFQDFQFLCIKKFLLNINIKDDEF